MSKKQVRMFVEYSALFHNPKWMCEIKLSGFSSRRAEDNRKLINSMFSLIKKYNNKGG